MNVCKNFYVFCIIILGLSVSMIDISVTIRPNFSAVDWADIVIEDNLDDQVFSMCEQMSNETRKVSICENYQ